MTLPGTREIGAGHGQWQGPLLGFGVSVTPGDKAGSMGQLQIVPGVGTCPVVLTVGILGVTTGVIKVVAGNG